MKKTNHSPKKLKVPRLALLLASGKKILIIGGVPISKKIEFLRQQFKFKIKIEWPDVIGQTVSRRLKAYEKQIQQGTVACVLLVNRIQSHQTVRAIVNSCKTNQTPFCLVGTAGMKSMKEALERIDKSLPA